MTHQRKPALGWPWAVLSAGAAAIATPLPIACAQMHHVDAPERVTRAVGVYEWTGDLSKPTAVRFVPVSLFINGHFEDAGLYLARPVPFALEPGDVYALERAGEPQGLIDLKEARRVVTNKALADDDPEGAWYAYGKFKPETPPPAPKLHPSAHVSQIQSSGGTPAKSTEDDGKPQLARRGGSSGSPSGTPSSPNSGTDGSTAPSSTGQSGSSPAADSGRSGSDQTSADDTDRPSLRRRDPSQDPERRREYGTKSRQASVTAAGPALGEDPDRPILGRSPEVDTGPAELTGMPADMHQAVAVSDATHSDAHPFARDWDSPAERSDTLAAMEALAKPQVAAYMQANGLVPSAAPLPVMAAVATTAAAGSPSTSATPASPATPDAPASPDMSGAPPKLERGVPKAYQNEAPAAAPAAVTPAPSTQPAAAASAQTSAKTAPAAHTSGTHPVTRAVAHRTTARPSPQHAVPLTFADPQVVGYTLSYGGLPTFVFTAAASAVARPSGAATAAAHTAVYVTVVAQRLPSGELQTNLSSVTDSRRLDVNPRLRLIDAVDPDDSHRASLLFELRGSTGRQFALYRLTAVQAEQTFTTASIE